MTSEPPEGADGISSRPLLILPLLKHVDKHGYGHGYGHEHAYGHDNLGKGRFGSDALTQHAWTTGAVNLVLDDSILSPLR